MKRALLLIAGDLGILGAFLFLVGFAGFVLTTYLSL